MGDSTSGGEADAGMNVFLACRIGSHSHFTRRTMTFKSSQTKAAPLDAESGTASPSSAGPATAEHSVDFKGLWQAAATKVTQEAPAHHTLLRIHRDTEPDDGLLHVEAWHEGLLRDEFIGAVSLDVNEVLSNMEDKQWKLMDFNLLQGDANDSKAGAVQVRMRWIPTNASSVRTPRLSEVAAAAKSVTLQGVGHQKSVDRSMQRFNSRDGASSPPTPREDQSGVLEMEVLKGNDLRDIRNHPVIRDMDTFVDTGTVWVMLALFVAYVVVGMVVYIPALGWSFIDTLIFILATFTTIGFDGPFVTPENSKFSAHPYAPGKYKGVKVFTCAYILVGMGVLGTLGGALGTYFLKWNAKVERRKRRHKLIEREQSQESDEESEDQAVYGAGGGAAAQAAAAAVASGGGAADEEGSETKTPGAAGSHHGLGLVEHEMEAISEFAMGAVWVAQQRALQAKRMLRKYFMRMMRELLRTLGLLVGVLFCGAAGYVLLQDLNLVDAVYFSTVASSTVGYGDIIPNTTTSKWFTIVYIPFAVVLISRTVTVLVRIPLDMREMKLENFVLDQFGDELTEYDFIDLKRSVCLHSEDMLRKNDFTLAMLIRLGRVEPYDLERIERTFFMLDKNNDGQLASDDIVDYVDITEKH